MLINEINDLRRELKISRTQVHDLETSLNVLRKQHHTSNTANQQATGMNEKAKGTIFDEGEARHIIDLQKHEIRKLRLQIRDLEANIAARPPSGKLPPMSQITI